MQSATFPQLAGNSQNWPDRRVRDEDRTRIDSDGLAIYFGRFCIFPITRMLLCEGVPVEVGGRAFDLLMVLVEARGSIVAKNKIIDYVWPSTIVDEGNLRFQVGALRKVLGKDKDLLKTVTGRGYMLVSETTEFPRGRALPTALEPVLPPPSESETLSPANDSLSVTTSTAPQHRDELVVAIIDDDEAVRDSLAGLLLSTGYHVACFNSIDDFLDGDGSARAGCLILDVWLPGRSGLDFVEEFARSKIDVPVIFISGYADVPMSVRAMKAGAAEFFTKPVRYQDLLSAVTDAFVAGST